MPDDLAATDPFREGIELAAATIEHHLGNQLARVVARCELIADDQSVSEEARELAAGALRAAMEASESFQRLRRALRAGEHRTVAGLTILDLGASSEADPAEDI
jgi:hypothetical protein